MCIIFSCVCRMCCVRFVHSTNCVYNTLRVMIVLRMLCVSCVASVVCVLRVYSPKPLGNKFSNQSIQIASRIIPPVIIEITDWVPRSRIYWTTPVKCLTTSTWGYNLRDLCFCCWLYSCFSVGMIELVNQINKHVQSVLAWWWRWKKKKFAL